MSIVRRLWKLSSALITALIVWTGLHSDAFKDVTQELIALFGLLMAAVLPSMVLTASVLRSGNLSVKRLLALRDALIRQQKVWIGLFLFSLIACALVIVGKMCSWDLPIRIHTRWFSVDLQFSHGLNAAIAFCAVLVLIRGFDVGRGLLSLLELSSEIALSEAVARETEKAQPLQEAVQQLRPREGFGEYLDLRH